MSSRDGKLTPVDAMTTNPLADVVAQLRSDADTAERDINTPYAIARAQAFREAANRFERALSSVRAIIRV